MCNNNCCMCCQCDNTHDEDTPQEITYTSVCDSESCKRDCCKCCCCKKKEMCEDDPNIRLDGMEERMEECCDEVNSRITELECNLAEEIERSTGRDKEHDDKIADLYYKESLDYNNVDYTLDNHNLVVNFYHDDVFQDKITIPVESFIKDWFVDTVALIDGHILRITFNVDPTTGTQHESIDIDLNNFLNPANYYTKEQIDSKITPLSQTINNIAGDLNAFKTTVSSTYETKDSAKNHVTGGSFDNATRYLTLTKENAAPDVIYIPDADIDNKVKQTICTDDAAIPVLLAYSASPTSGTDAGSYYSSVTINPHTNVINGTAEKAKKDQNGDVIDTTYLKSATASSTYLTKTDAANTYQTVANDNDHYPTNAVVSGSTVTINGNTGFVPFNIDLSGISGTTNVTYGGQSVTIQAAIDAIVNRLAAQEGLWKKTSNNDGLEPVTATHKVYGYGFYDTAVTA